MGSAFISPEAFAILKSPEASGNINADSKSLSRPSNEFAGGVRAGDSEEENNQPNGEEEMMKQIDGNVTLSYIVQPKTILLYCKSIVFGWTYELICEEEEKSLLSWEPAG